MSAMKAKPMVLVPGLGYAVSPAGIGFIRICNGRPNA